MWRMGIAGAVEDVVGRAGSDVVDGNDRRVEWRQMAL
jgi:hypothetical protein